MKARIRKSHTNLVYLVLAFITLFSLVIGGCSAPSSAEPTTASESAEVEVAPPTEESPPPTATQIPPTEEPPTPTEVPITLSDIAAEVAEEVGVVTTVVENEAQPVIFVFEERHDSILGQIEIAIMLNRLYEDHGLRHIGLEGYMAGEEPLNLAWAHREPYFQPDQAITGHEDVMVQMTQEGEFSAVELVGLLYYDVVVDGIDNAELYAFNPPEEAWDAPDFYLYYIALAGMSEVEHTAWQSLYDSEQYDAAFDFAMGSDEFTAEMYAKLSDSVDIVSAEEWLTALHEIAAQAEAVEVDLTEADIANLEAMGEYFEHVSQRSDAMVTEMLDLANANFNAPLAVNIGALHTEHVVELLTEAGVSFAVIRPLSLAEGSTAGLLSAEAYQRKQQGLSVAPDGWMGSFLDGRKKPPPVADKERIKLEYELRQLVQALAGTANVMAQDGKSLSEIQDTLIFMSKAFSNLEIRGVVPGDEANPNPQVKLTLKLDDGRTLDITAQVITGSSLKLGLEIQIEERLKDAWQGVNDFFESLEDAAKEGTETKPQKICSDTEVTKITETGG